MEKKGCTLHGEENLALQAAAQPLLPLALLIKKQACCKAGTWEKVPWRRME